MPSSALLCLRGARPVTKSWEGEPVEAGRGAGEVEASLTPTPKVPAMLGEGARRGPRRCARPRPAADAGQELHLPNLPVFNPGHELPNVCSVAGSVGGVVRGAD